MRASMWDFDTILNKLLTPASSEINMNSLYTVNNRVMGKYFFAIGLVVMMMSCGKDIDEFIPRASQVPAGDISRLMTRLQSDIAGDVFTTVSCPCSGDRVFKIDKDLVLVIPVQTVPLISMLPFVIQKVKS